MYAALLLLAACLPSGWMVEQKALDVYVKQYDPHYRYTLMKKEEKWGATVYTLNMTSLKWLNESELTNPIWWHELIIAVSKEQKLKDSCLLMIGNGKNEASNTPTDLSVDELVNLAKSTGSCAALLGQIPNQPITYKTIPLQMCKNSVENAAVYCTWWKFMNNKSEQPYGLIQFPMVKAAVRGIDTIIDFLLKESGGTVKITKFTLTGISKRGWVTWLTAAVDKRVVSFIPIVYDLLNFVKNRHHQYRAYCGWGRSLEVFYQLNLTRQLDSPRFKELTSYVDPFEYNERYQNKPKCLICGTGDGINPPDDSHYFFDQLAGVKYIRFLPNTTHHVASRPLDKASILESCRAIYLSTMQNLNMPQISWKRVETNSKGIIHLRIDQEPSATKCFFANTLDPERRDFRRFKGHRVSWFPCKVEKVKTCVYKAEMTKPRIGWRGFFIEVTFLGSEEKKYVFTSEVHIIPGTFPCADCKGEECYGRLV